MKIGLHLLALPVLILLPGCMLFSGSPSGPNTVPEKYILQPGARTPGDVPVESSKAVEPALPTLYGRDGSPVSAQPAGSITERRPTHEIQNADGSRMYILELYQQAIEDKEALLFEVEGLAAALERTQDMYDQSETRVLEMQKMIEDQRKEIERRKMENIELASRLTTAQIRRLESEKLLLEAKLEWQRLQRAIESAGKSDLSREAGSRP